MVCWNWMYSEWICWICWCIIFDWRQGFFKKYTSHAIQRSAYSTCQIQLDNGSRFWDRKILLPFFKIHRLQPEILHGDLSVCSCYHVTYFIKLKPEKVNAAWTLKAPGARVWTLELEFSNFEVLIFFQSWALFGTVDVSAGLFFWKCGRCIIQWKATSAVSASMLPANLGL